MILNADEMLRELQKNRRYGRLFQMVGAAIWKPRVPHDKLHRVTDNRLAEADHKVLHGVCPASMDSLPTGTHISHWSFSPSFQRSLELLNFTLLGA